MSEDIKTIASDLGSAFEEFKKSYDEKLDKMAKGENTSELDAKLAAIESKMDNYEDINQRIVQSQKSQEALMEQMDRVEVAMRRPNSGLSTKQVDAGIKAFDAYCRKGIEGSI